MASSRTSRPKGQNFHAGLAKASWGWVKREIFSGASEDASWKRRKNDRRDPTKSVDGAFAETRSGNKSAAAVSIENRLDYICDALPEDAQRAAIEAAQRDLAWRIENDTKRFLG